MAGNGYQTLPCSQSVAQGQLFDACDELVRHRREGRISHQPCYNIHLALCTHQDFSWDLTVQHRAARDKGQRVLRISVPGKESIALVVMSVGFATPPVVGSEVLETSGSLEAGTGE